MRFIVWKKFCSKIGLRHLLWVQWTCWLYGWVDSHWTWVVLLIDITWKVRVWNIGSHLEHRCSSSLKFLVFWTVEVGIEFYWRESDEIHCVVKVLLEERFETFALSSMNLLTIGMSRFPLNLNCSSNWHNMAFSADVARYVHKTCED